MDREQAIAHAASFVAARGLTVGAVCAAWFSDGSEFADCRVLPPPRWVVHFAYAGPPWEQLPPERRELLSHGWDEPTIVSVDDATGRIGFLVTL